SRCPSSLRIAGALLRSGARGACCWPCKAAAPAAGLSLPTASQTGIALRRTDGLDGAAAL
ncbi:hypothetical protein, partial [Kitasatospora albolonga]|uniref:hypothetical protein n=1 Tax=Kitasatospora albolonga TaxID=68173 RepID=UPI0031F107FA